MKIKKDSLINFYIICLIFYIFSNFIYKIQTPIIICMTFGLIIINLVIARKKISINIIDVLLLTLGIVFIFSAIISPRSGEAIKYSIAFMCLVINFILLSKEKNINYDLINNCIIIFSSIHVIGTLLYPIFPDLMRKIVALYLKGAELENNYFQFKVFHINCGLTYVQSANAMYIVAFISAVFSKVINNKSKLKYIIFLILGVIALLSSSKRGVMLACIVATIFSIIIYGKKTKKINIIRFFKFFILSVVVIILGYYLANEYFPDSLRIFGRFSQDNVTSGRDVMYSILYENYTKGNWLIGQGLFSSRTVLLSTLSEANDAHNIYLQLLVETGIIGILLFILYIFTLFIKILKIIINKKNGDIYVAALFYIITFLMYGMTGNDLFDLSMLPMFLIYVSLILSLYHTKK